jgi:hypothetical protein
VTLWHGLQNVEVNTTKGEDINYEYFCTYDLKGTTNVACTNLQDLEPGEKVYDY